MEAPQPQVSADAYYLVKSAREDAREQISANAKYIARAIDENAREASGRIVKHMWIIFVLLPVVLGILFVILRA